jgi:hypothetical protein
VGLRRRKRRRAVSRPPWRKRGRRRGLPGSPRRLLSIPAVGFPIPLETTSLPPPNTANLPGGDGGEAIRVTASRTIQTPLDHERGERCFGTSGAPFSQNQRRHYTKWWDSDAESVGGRYLDRERSYEGVGGVSWSLPEALHRPPSSYLESDTKPGRHSRLASNVSQRPAVKAQAFKGHPAT